MTTPAQLAEELARKIKEESTNGIGRWVIRNEVALRKALCSPPDDTEKTINSTDQPSQTLCKE